MRGPSCRATPSARGPAACRYPQSSTPYFHGLAAGERRGRFRVHVVRDRLPRRRGLFHVLRGTIVANHPREPVAFVGRLEEQARGERVTDHVELGDFAL